MSGGGERSKCGLLQWCERHEKTISLLLSGITTLATVVGVWLVIPQIIYANKVFVATTQYQISKDSAELWDTIPPAVWVTVSQNSGTLDTESERHTLRIFSYVASVLEQKEFVTPEFLAEFMDGFCGFVHLPLISSYWHDKIATGERKFNTDFVALKNKCDKL